MAELILETFAKNQMKAYIYWRDLAVLEARIRNNLSAIEGRGW